MGSLPSGPWRLEAEAIAGRDSIQEVQGQQKGRQDCQTQSFTILK